jgi:hypothetical protein
MTTTHETRLLRLLFIVSPEMLYHGAMAASMVGWRARRAHGDKAARYGGAMSARVMWPLGDVHNLRDGGHPLERA